MVVSIDVADHDNGNIAIFVSRRPYMIMRSGASERDDVDADD